MEGIISDSIIIKDKNTVTALWRTIHKVKSTLVLRQKGGMFRSLRKGNRSLGPKLKAKSLNFLNDDFSL